MSTQQSTYLIWDDAPPLSSVDAPAMLFDAGELWLAYASDEVDEEYAVVRFRGVVEYSMTRCSDGSGVRSRSPYAGLRPHAINELVGSSKTIEHSVVDRSDSLPITTARHWVATFNDCLVEIVSSGDADPVTARRPRHCFAGHLATVIAASCRARSEAEALLKTFLSHARRQPGLCYGNGEVAKVGDRVDDNGQMAVVEQIVLNATGLGADEMGLSLRWDIGLPVFRPISSKLWDGIRLLPSPGPAE